MSGNGLWCKHCMSHHHPMDNCYAEIWVSDSTDDRHKPEHLKKELKQPDVQTEKDGS